MKAGLLREKIDVFERVENKSEFGDKSTCWEYSFSTRAGITHLGGSRTVENNEIFFPANKEFLVRYYVPIDEQMRIKYENKMYRILSVETNKYYNDKVVSVELINE